jgi:hypothetical protein
MKILKTVSVFFFKYVKYVVVVRFISIYIKEFLFAY